MKFPMIVKHRTDAHSSIVVASQEQYDELPEEFKPELVSGETGTASAPASASAANLAALEQARAALEADRSDLAKAESEFQAHVQGEMAKIDAARAALEADIAAFEASKQPADAKPAAKGGK